MPVFKTPVGARRINAELARRLLNGAGTGQVTTPVPGSKTRIAKMFRKLSEKEERNYAFKNV